MAKAPMVLDLDKPIYVGMESFSTLVDMKVVSDDGKVVEPTLIRFDKASGNSCEYPREDFMKSLQESLIVNRLLRSNCWFGEYEHPDRDAPLSRIIKIEPTRYCWLIEKFWVNDKENTLEGRCRFVAPLGTTIAQPNMVNAGTNLAASVRSLTPNVVEKNEGGKLILVKKFPVNIITFDCVILPGFEEARLADADEFQAKRRAAGFESINYRMDRPGDALIDFVRSSESFDILQDLYKVDMQDADITFMKDRRVAIRTKNGLSLNVAMENFLANELL